MSAEAMTLREAVEELDADTVVCLLNLSRFLEGCGKTDEANFLAITAEAIETANVASLIAVAEAARRVLVPWNDAENMDSPGAAQAMEALADALGGLSDTSQAER